MGLKFQATQGVGDPLQGVLDRVGKVVHGVDAPSVALAVMMDITDTINDRVAHIKIAGGQVDLRPQGPRPLREFPGTHPGEKIEVLLHRAVPIR